MNLFLLLFLTIWILPITYCFQHDNKTVSFHYYYQNLDNVPLSSDSIRVQVNVWEPIYLAGVLGAYMSANQIVGQIIEPSKDGNLDKQMQSAFFQGIRSVTQRVRLVTGMIGGSERSVARGMEIAERHMDAASDVVLLHIEDTSIIEGILKYFETTNVVLILYGMEKNLKKFYSHSSVLGGIFINEDELRSDLGEESLVVFGIKDVELIFKENMVDNEEVNEEIYDQQKNLETGQIDFDGTQYTGYNLHV